MLRKQGFTGPKLSDWTGEPSWAVFHLGLSFTIADFLPVEMSIDKTKLYLIDQRQRQDKDFHPFMLWRLGGPHLDNEMGRWDNVRGKSQENIPIHTILPFANAYGLSIRPLALNAHGSIMFQIFF